MKKIIAIIAILMSMSATAEVSTSGLTSVQIAELAAKADEMKEAAKNPVNVSTTVRKEAEAWGELGANMGKAMVSAAREIGVGANEFSGTTLGKVTVAVVVYKIIGKSILGVIFGIGILIFGYSTALYILTHLRFGLVYKYDYKPVLFGFWSRKVVVESSKEDTDYTNWRIAIGIILLVLTTMVGLSVIFKG